MHVHKANVNEKREITIFISTEKRSIKWVTPYRNKKPPYQLLSKYYMYYSKGAKHRMRSRIYFL